MLFPKDYAKMLLELLNDTSDQMTRWEIDFIEGVDRQEAILDNSQQRKLKEIWNKVLG